jgi:hypothetical protein
MLMIGAPVSAFEIARAASGMAGAAAATPTPNGKAARAATANNRLALMPVAPFLDFYSRARRVEAFMPLLAMWGRNRRNPTDGEQGFGFLGSMRRKGPTGRGKAALQARQAG